MTEPMTRLQLESYQFRCELDKIEAERRILKETVNYLLESNIDLKTNHVLQEKVIEDLRKEIDELNKKLTVANTIVNQTTGLIPEGIA